MRKYLLALALTSLAFSTAGHAQDGRGTPEEQKAAQTYSHSINPDSLLRFDAQGGLLSLVIPTDAVKNLDDFLFFFEWMVKPSLRTGD